MISAKFLFHLLRSDPLNQYSKIFFPIIRVQTFQNHHTSISKTVNVFKRSTEWFFVTKVWAVRWTAVKFLGGKFLVKMKKRQLNLHLMPVQIQQPCWQLLRAAQGLALDNFPSAAPTQWRALVHFSFFFSWGWIRSIKFFLKSKLDWITFQALQWQY